MSRNGFSGLLVLFVLAGGVRFLLAITTSPQTWSSHTYMEVVYDQQRATDRAIDTTELKRRWGPIFLAAMDELGRLPISETTLHVSLRVLLTLLYVANIVLLSMLFSEAPHVWGAVETRWRRAILVFLCCQSSAAIYAISDGTAEIVTGFCVVGHFYFFMRRRFALAAVLMAVGIYFKLFPIVFAFPYFLFSALSRNHRGYCAWLTTSCLAVALASVPIAGWKFGFFYPTAMMGSVVTDAEVIPILSREVFSLVSVFARASSSFHVRAVDARALALARTLSQLFSVLLIMTTGLAAVVLRKYERSWDTDVRSRQIALVIFQSVIGFLMFLFSTDVSITFLLLIAVSLYSPLWLVVDRITLVLFVAGLTLIGNLIPISLLVRALPLGWLDRLAGNPPYALIPYEKYIWYEIPMLGVVLIALAFCWSVSAIRHDRRWQKQMTDIRNGTAP